MPGGDSRFNRTLGHTATHALEKELHSRFGISYTMDGVPAIYTLLLFLVCTVMGIGSRP